MNENPQPHMTNQRLHLNDTQNGELMKLISEAESFPGGAVLAEVSRHSRDPNKADLIVSVVPPRQARLIARIREE